jgi:hypothetical protein
MANDHQARAAAGAVAGGKTQAVLIAAPRKQIFVVEREGDAARRAIARRADDAFPVTVKQTARSFGSKPISSPQWQQNPRDCSITKVS